MSWEATTWATKQKTGSPHAKLLLLLLANRADEEGICWPSQRSLAEASEQSEDTIQRHLSKLEMDGLIRRERRLRTGGKWLGYVYQLMMPRAHGPAEGSGGLIDKPAQKRAHHAAVSGLVDKPAAPKRAHQAAESGMVDNKPTRPLSAVSPSRSLRRHHAAVSGVESSVESPIESSHAPKRGSNAGSASASQGRRERTEVVQNRIAQRLGPDGWLILGAMSDAMRSQLTRLEAAYELDDATLNTARELGARSGALAAAASTNDRSKAK